MKDQKPMSKPVRPCYNSPIEELDVVKQMRPLCRSLYGKETDLVKKKACLERRNTTLQHEIALLTDELSKLAGRKQTKETEKSSGPADYRVILAEKQAQLCETARLLGKTKHPCSERAPVIRARARLALPFGQAAALKKRLTRVRAIKGKCFDCSGYSVKDRANCEHTDCPLYPFRLGKRPPGSRPKKAILNYCRWCYNGKSREVSGCPIADCPLHPYRSRSLVAYTRRTVARI